MVGAAERLNMRIVGIDMSLVGTITVFASDAPLSISFVAEPGVGATVISRTLATRRMRVMTLDRADNHSVDFRRGWG
jgi:hypothetical protein